MGRIIKVNPKFGAFEIYIASWVLSGFFYSCMIAIGSILEGSAGLEESISNFDGSFAILVGPVLGFFMGITFGLPGLAICKSLISNGTSNVTFYVVGAVLYGTTLTWILISFFSGFNGG